MIGSPTVRCSQFACMQHVAGMFDAMRGSLTVLRLDAKFS